MLVGQVRDFETVAAGEVLQEGVENIYREVKLEDEETAQAVLTYHYMANLKPDHRKLNAMIAVAELAAESGVEVIFYITPVNKDRASGFWAAHSANVSPKTSRWCSPGLKRPLWRT